MLDAERVDRVICLGDLVGYHAEPAACIAAVRARCAVVVAGDHDRAVAGMLDPVELPYVARRAIAWTRRALPREQLEYLRSLPTFVALDPETCLVHGALAPIPNCEVHINTPSRIATNLLHLATRRERVCWFGHTREPAIHAWRNGTSIAMPAADAFDLAADQRYLINPGSVGQSRDSDPRAAFAIVDGEHVEFRRAEFDHNAVQASDRAAGLLSSPNVIVRSFEAARSRFLAGRPSAPRRIREI